MLLGWLKYSENMPRLNDIYGSLVLHSLFIPFSLFSSDLLIQIELSSSPKSGGGDHPHPWHCALSLPTKATVVPFPQFC